MLQCFILLFSFFMFFPTNGCENAKAHSSWENQCKQNYQCEKFDLRLRCASREIFVVSFFLFYFFPSFSVALSLTLFTIQFLISRSVIHKFDIIRIEMLNCEERRLKEKKHNFKILFTRCLCPAVVRRVKKNIDSYPAFWLLCKKIDKQRI